MLHEPWHIHLLGGLRLQHQSTVIEHFRTRKAAALLAYLALYARRQHAREELAEILWPDEKHSAQAKAHNLNQALSTLRRYLEPTPADRGTILRSTHTHIALNQEAVVVDVAEFEVAVRLAARSSEDRERREHLTRAAALYTGDLLPGMYEEWALRERDRLQEQYTQTLLQLSEQGGEQGKSTPALLPVAPPLPPALVSSLSVTVSPDNEAIQQPASITHLPLTLTTFFGRETEMKKAAKILDGARLLTLTGAGGSGKTRLAIEVGRRQTTHFDTIVFVALADVANPHDLLPAIADTLASALKQPQTSPAPYSDAWQNALAQIETLLANRCTLLILDNCEHLLKGVSVIPALLKACPHLSCLATSRSPLHLSGERVLAVAPFPCPDDTLVPDELQTRPSIQLFLDRAQAVRSDFRLTERNASILAGLCADLDGLPLALELAAARIGTFSLSEMRQQLADGKQRFQLLVSRHRDTHHRHHSLTAALDWSYCQLMPAQQRFFARLSLLHGAWTVDAARAVGGGAEMQDTRDTLERLCVASLIVTNTGECDINEPAESTFHLLETMRQFGQQQLTPEEIQDASACHARFYLKLAEKDASEAEGPTTAWIGRMERYAPNLTAALDWCFGPHGEDVLALRLCLASKDFLRRRGRYAEALNWLHQAHALTAPNADAALKTSILSEYSRFASLCSEHKTATRLGQECVRLRRQQQNPLLLAQALHNLGHYLWLDADLVASEIAHREALALREHAQDARGMAHSYNCLGTLALDSGDTQEAQRCWQQNLALSHVAQDDIGVGGALCNLALLAVDAEDWTAALTLIAESMLSLERAKDARWLANINGMAFLAYAGAGVNDKAQYHYRIALQSLEAIGDEEAISGLWFAQGRVALTRGDPATAKKWLRQSAEISLPFASNSISTNYMRVLTREYALIAYTEQSFKLGVQIHACAQAMYDRTGSRHLPSYSKRLETYKANAQATLGAEIFQCAWDKGQAMEWNEVLGHILTL